MSYSSPNRLARLPSGGWSCCLANVVSLLLLSMFPSCCGTFECNLCRLILSELCLLCCSSTRQKIIHTQVFLKLSHKFCIFASHVSRWQSRTTPSRRCEDIRPNSALVNLITSSSERSSLFQWNLSASQCLLLLYALVRMPSLNLQLLLWDKTTDAQEHPRVCFATVTPHWDNHWGTVLMVSLEQMRHKQSAFLWTRYSPSPLVYGEYKTQPPGQVVRGSRLHPAPSALR